jgi:hypothetical protein
VTDLLQKTAEEIRVGIAMRLAIMQPYFLPYIGYFQLISAVDAFVVYDNIKYTKKGWINRNRILINGADAYLSLPLKGASDSLCIFEREIAENFNRAKVMDQIKGSYQRAPHFAATGALVERILNYSDGNLFRFLFNSIMETCAHVGLRSRFIVSSQLPIDHALRAQDKVLAICEFLKARVYINPIGGIDLYSKDAFRARGVELKFARARHFEYAQFGAPFVPWLSIVDVLMFNPLDAVLQQILTGYDLV